jgi:hypothetical protein
VPALIIAGAFGGVLLVVAVLGWFTGVFVARMPSGLRDLGCVSLRYVIQTYAYLFLVTDRYPYSAPFLRSDPHDEQLALEVEPSIAPPRLYGEPA